MDNDILGGEIMPTSILLPTGEKIEAEFHVWDIDPLDPAKVKIALHFGEKQIVVSDEDNVAALRSIRLQLEPDGLRLNCYGASRNFYASPMSIDMGAGEKGYRLKLGEQAKIASLVFIFDTGADVDPVTVAEQETFFEAWTKSISR